MRKLVTYGIMTILPIFLLILPIDHVFALTIKEQKECLSKIPPSATNAEKIVAKKKCESQSRNQAYQQEKIDEKKRLQIKTISTLDKKILSEYMISIKKSPIDYADSIKSDIGIQPIVKIDYIRDNTKLKNQYGVIYHLCAGQSKLTSPIVHLWSDSEIYKIRYVGIIPQKSCKIFEVPIVAKEPDAIKTEFYTSGGKVEQLYNLISDRGLSR